MMKPEFAAFVHRLCVHFDRKDPVAERMDTLFKAVSGMSVDKKRLDAMHGWFVSAFDELPRNLSKAMWDAHSATRIITPTQGGQEEQGPSDPVSWSPPDPELAAKNQQRCREIMEALRTGIRPPWAGEPRAACCSQDTVHTTAGAGAEK